MALSLVAERGQEQHRQIAISSENLGGSLRPICPSCLAVRLIEEWRGDCNEVRPHSSLDGMTPKEYAEAKHGLTSKAASRGQVRRMQRKVALAGLLDLHPDRER